MVILPNRFDVLRARPGTFGAKGMKPFTAVPTIVAARGQEIDFLVEVLAHVGRPELAGRAVERHAPDIAEPIGPDFRPGVFDPDKRIVLGDGIVLSRLLVVDVEAEHFTEQRLQVLAVAEWIIGCAAVP